VWRDSARPHPGAARAEVLLQKSGYMSATMIFIAVLAPPTPLLAYLRGSPPPSRLSSSGEAAWASPASGPQSHVLQHRF
jgi:hypothetical protein